jgi:hypothetical protein
MPDRRYLSHEDEGGYEALDGLVAALPPSLALCALVVLALSALH